MGIPAEAMDGKGVEKLVGEDDSAHGRTGRCGDRSDSEFIQGLGPMQLSLEFGQGLLLPLVPAVGGLYNPVFHLLEE